MDGIIKINIAVFIEKENNVGLHKAIIIEDLEAVPWLLLNRTNVNVKNNYGEISLVVALQQFRGNSEILKEFLNNSGADLNAKNNMAKLPSSFLYHIPKLV